MLYLSFLNIANHFGRSNFKYVINLKSVLTTNKKILNATLKKSFLRSHFPNILQI